MIREGTTLDAKSFEIPHPWATCHQLGSLRPPLHHTEAKSLPCGRGTLSPPFSSPGLWFFSTVTQGRQKGPWEVNQTAFNDVTLVSFLMNHNPEVIFVSKM